MYVKMFPAKDEQEVMTHRFDIGDSAWKRHLRKEGYVVIKDAISSDMVKELTDDIFQWWEDIPIFNFRRDDTSTWEFEYPGNPDNGVISSFGVGQADFMWKMRTQPKIKGAFKMIWGTADLISTFDVINIFRPWNLNASWKGREGGFHVDQNGRKPHSNGFQSVQGFVYLTDQDEDTGGLTVIPRSHLEFSGLAKRCNYWDGNLVQLEVPCGDPILKNGRKKLVTAKAGDLCLWDGRLTHGCFPGLSGGSKSEHGNWEMIRMGMYVSMGPREKATEEVLKYRQTAYEEHISTAHASHLWIPHKKSRNIVPHVLKPTEEIRNLIGLLRKERTPDSWVSFMDEEEKSNEDAVVLCGTKIKLMTHIPAGGTSEDSLEEISPTGYCIVPPRRSSPDDENCLVM